jgi:hypothetical protein
MLQVIRLLKNLARTGRIRKSSEDEYVFEVKSVAIHVYS